MQKAVDRIHQAIDSQELITVYGDYDADGITSTTILVETLEVMGLMLIIIFPIDLLKAMVLIKLVIKI